MAIQGGRSPANANNFRYYLTKPYDLTWPPSAEQWMNLDQMLVELYDAGRTQLTTLEEGGIIDSETGEANNIGGTAGEVVLVIKDISAAEVKALTTTPVEIVPTPGAGLVNIPIFWSICHSVGVAFNANVTAAVQFTNATTISLSNIIIVASAATGVRIGYGESNAEAGAVDVTDSALEIQASAGVPTTGTLVNDKMRICVLYVTVEAPF